MIDLLDDELPVCRRCGLQLTDKPRLRYQRKIYCFRCAKQVTKPIESREYDRILHYKQELEIRNQEILNEYERQQDEWKQNRDSWVSQHTPSFGQFFFLAIFILIVSFSIYPIIGVIAIVFGLPSWLIFVYYRRAKLRLQYEKEHPYPSYPELYNTRDIKLAEAEGLDILFSKEEVYEKRKIPRQSILKRDRFTCQSCGEPKTPENLEVHHILPRVVGGPDCNANLIVLCKFCHDHEYWFGHVRSYATTFAKPTPKRRRQMGWLFRV